MNILPLPSSRTCCTNVNKIYGKIQNKGKVWLYIFVYNMKQVLYKTGVQFLQETQSKQICSNNYGYFLKKSTKTRKSTAEGACRCLRKGSTAAESTAKRASGCSRKGAAAAEGSCGWLCKCPTAAETSAKCAGCRSGEGSTAKEPGAAKKALGCRHRGGQGAAKQCRQEDVDCCERHSWSSPVMLYSMEGDVWGYGVVVSCDHSIASVWWKWIAELELRVGMP